MPYLDEIQTLILLQYGEEKLKDCISELIDLDWALAGKLEQDDINESFEYHKEAAAVSTKMERLFETVKKYDWEYAKARFISKKDYITKDNMDGNLGDTFIGRVFDKQSRDKYVLEYRAPVTKFHNKNGRLTRATVDYTKAEWRLIPRISNGRKLE